MTTAADSSKPVRLPAPGAVRWITRTLEEAGHETWAVGGAVRDALAGISPGDWDLATAAKPGQVRSLFPRTIPIGIEHGTVGVLSRDGRMYELTTFRHDVETDGRHARVVFSRELDEDLARRDFTVNAIAWHPLREEVRDPYNGAEDLRNGRLRTVGDAAERFAEDRLRVLRAFRFAGRFDLRVDPETWEAAVAAAEALPALSPERVREELVKVLSLWRGATVALDLYARSGALSVLYPELAASEHAPPPPGFRDGTLWDYLLDAVRVVAPTRLRIRLAALMQTAGGIVPAPGRPAREAGGAARQLLTRLRSSNAERDVVTHLVVHLPTVPTHEADDAEIRRWLSMVGAEHANDLLRLSSARDRALGQASTRSAAAARQVRNVLRQRPALSVGDLAIGGAELKALGIRPGPRFRTILDSLLDRVLEDPDLNRPERLREMVREMPGSAGGSAP